MPVSQPLLRLILRNSSAPSMGSGSRSVWEPIAWVGSLLCLVVGLVVGLAGCGQTGGFLLMNADSQRGTEAEEVFHREEYLGTHSADSLRWLLLNRLRNGMSKNQVDAVIGEEGEREFRDQEILGEGGLYRSDDIVYRWGPDRDGNSYLLVFRDDHLVNFENFRNDLDTPYTPNKETSKKTAETFE